MAKKAAKKKVTSKKAAATPKKAPAKKAAVKKTAKSKAPAEKASAKKAPAKKAVAKKAVKKTSPIKKKVAVKRRPLMSHLAPKPVMPSAAPGGKPKKLSAAFLKAQKQKLLDLRDTLVDQMNGVARDSLGRGEEGGDSSAFGMHQADAGSDAYDRDFALNILSQEQNALNEIDEALHRIEGDAYGVCEGSGEMIPQARLEAMPFARCTVDFQEKLDLEQAAGNHRSPMESLFESEDRAPTKST